MTEVEKKLLRALAFMVLQYLDGGSAGKLTGREQKGLVSGEFMYAGENAINLLVEHGLLTGDGYGADWTEAGEALIHE